MVHIHGCQTNKCQDDVVQTLSTNRPSGFIQPSTQCDCVNLVIGKINFVNFTIKIL